MYKSASASSSRLSELERLKGVLTSQQAQLKMNQEDLQKLQTQREEAETARLHAENRLKGKSTL